MSRHENSRLINIMVSLLLHGLLAFTDTWRLVVGFQFEVLDIVFDIVEVGISTWCDIGSSRNTGSISPVQKIPQYNS